MGQCYNITFHPPPFLFYINGWQFYIIKTIFLDTTKPPFSLTDTVAQGFQTTKYSTNKIPTFYKPFYPYLQSTQKPYTDTVGRHLYGQSIFFKTPPCSTAYGIRDLLVCSNTSFKLFSCLPIDT